MPEPGLSAFARISELLAFNPGQPRDESGRWTDAKSGDEYIDYHDDEEQDRVWEGLSSAGAAGREYFNDGQTINTYLRSGVDLFDKLGDWDPDQKAARRERYEKAAKLLDKAINQAKPTSQPMVLHRAMPRLAGKMTVGKVLLDKAFTSTSMNARIAKGFGDKRSGGKGQKETVALKILVNKGAKVVRVGLLENEVVLPRNSGFKVVSVSGNGRSVTLQYLGTRRRP